METRVITIINQRTQEVSAIETDATTLGELKSAMSANGIDYAGQVFHECISNVELSDDSSLLPTNLPSPETGNPTNEIVISLTTQKKHISNGIMSRNDLYAQIKKNDLSAAIKQKYGKNYTNMSTEALDKAVSELTAKQTKANPTAENKAANKATGKATATAKTTTEPKEEKAETSSCNCTSFFKDLCQLLVDSKLIASAKIKPLCQKYGFTVDKPKTTESPYSAGTLRSFIRR